MFYIGIDDTDSTKGMCTTYIAARIADKLSSFTTVHELRLIRLNPSVPWKTRGNGAIAIIVKEKEIEKIKKIAIEEVEKNAMLEDERTNPGVVFFLGKIPEEFKKFYHLCLHRITNIAFAEKLAKKYNAEVIKYKNGRGIIGALAAIGSELEDYTYELIAYRKKENWGKKRKVDSSSVFEMDAKTFPLTFNNVDPDSKKILITPNTPCPVLLGVRGENPEILDKAFKMLKINEDVERVAIFKTNQATDAHLEEVRSIREIKDYSSIILEGYVGDKPKVIEGGHVFFKLTDNKHSIKCAAFEPTKKFRHVILRLIPGDRIRVFGSVKKRTINLEKIQVLKLVRHKEVNPICEKCGKRMESIGKGKGYRCKRCKTFASEKVKEKIDREIEEKFYEVPPAAMRHLTKPLIRMGKEKGS